MRAIILFVVFWGGTQAFAQAPIQGEELTKLLGMQKNSSQVQSLESYIGGNYEAKGVKLMYNADGLVTRVELFNNNNPWGENIQQFTGTLPHKMTFADKIYDAKKKLGEGFETDGEISGTLFLTKQFELNNHDSYKLSAEYRGGRLITLSLILVEGGSGDLMSDGTINKSNFKGESLLYMVKKGKANFELQELIKLFDTFHSYADKTHIIYADNGLEVVTDYSGNIQEVIVYSAGQTTSQGEPTGAFKYPLPYGLKFQDTQADVSQKLGAPAGNNNGAMYYNYGPSRLNVYFGSGKISKIIVTINDEFKVPEPAPKKTGKD